MVHELRRKAASTGRLSIGDENVSFRLAFSDGTQAADLEPFKFNDARLTLEPRNDPEQEQEQEPRSGGGGRGRR